MINVNHVFNMTKFRWYMINWLFNYFSKCTLRFCFCLFCFFNLARFIILSSCFLIITACSCSATTWLKLWWGEHMRNYRAPVLTFFFSTSTEIDPLAARVHSWIDWSRWRKHANWPQSTESGEHRPAWCSRRGTCSAIISNPGPSGDGGGEDVTPACRPDCT